MTKKNLIPPHVTNNIEDATVARDERVKSILEEGLASGSLTLTDVEKFRELELKFNKLNSDIAENSREDVEESSKELNKQSISETYTLMQEILSKAGRVSGKQ